MVVKVKEMNNNKISLALAVNYAGKFVQKHFGDADKFLIYEWDHDKLVFVKEKNNPFKTYDEEHEHGSQKKGRAIIDLLKGLNVNVLVSRQFGRNIKMVNHHFIPVIIYSEKPGEVTSVIKKHMKWIEDEIKNRPEAYKLFTIKNGILKTIIKQQ
ncbi:MAG: hypothetical protein JW723_10740 [Bacteroidales bacterium]|nr:hypothetical protein [Bacteroidales bacterium]